MTRQHSLIPESAEKLMHEQDEERHQARLSGAVPFTGEQFRQNFINTHLAEIESIRQGRIVQETRHGVPTMKGMVSKREARVRFFWSRHISPVLRTWEKSWQKLKRSVGTWMRNVISGVQSVLRTPGSTPKTK